MKKKQFAYFKKMGFRRNGYSFIIYVHVEEICSTKTLSALTSVFTKDKILLLIAV